MSKGNAIKPEPLPITWINGEPWLIFDEGDEWSIADGTRCPEMPWEKRKSPKASKSSAKGTRIARTKRKSRKPKRRAD